MLATCKDVRRSDAKRAQLWQQFLHQITEQDTDAMWSWQFEDVEEEESTVPFTGDISVQRVTQIAWSSFLIAKDKAREKEAKGALLESKANEVLAADADIVPKTVLQSRSPDNENYADKEATETTCGLLKTLLSNTHIAAVEVDASFWQINWCRVYVPENMQEACNADGTRLWFQVRVEDETGHITLFIREKAALSLAALGSKEEFENAIATETLSFPMKASVKIIRKSPGLQTPIKEDSSVEKPAQDDSQNQDETVRCYIVEAAEQHMQYAPSKRPF